MTNTNYPSSNDPQKTTTTTTRNRNNDNTKNIVIGVLGAIILGLGGYLVWDLTKDKEHEQVFQGKIASANTTTDSLRNEYSDALMRLDSITGINNNYQGQLSDNQSEISKLKGEINSILRKKNASAAELARAKSLIASLNDKIGTLEAEVARLTGENQQLATTNTVLQGEKQTLETNLQSTTAEKEVLAGRVDVGSTFTATRIEIKPLQEKRSGKEKETTNAKRVDKLMISFDVENRIAPSGPADIYVIVTGPNGQVISDPAAGVLTTRQDGDRQFTFKTTVDYEQGTRKNIAVPLRQNNFQTGNYKIEIYQNGFKIAEGIRSLKKGGIFG
jgi:regulator of replication initiation timing